MRTTWTTIEKSIEKSTNVQAQSENYKDASKWEFVACN